MQFSSIAAILAFGTAAVSATSMNLFSGTKCADGDFMKNLSLKSGCHAFHVANVRAVDVRTLSGTCTVAVYSDTSCSDNAKAAPINTCVSRSDGWKSYSVHNC